MEIDPFVRFGVGPWIYPRQGRQVKAPYASIQKALVDQSPDEGHHLVSAMLDLYDEFAALLGAFETNHVDYAVCGGLAMAIHGFPRATVAVDFLVPPAAQQSALACAYDLGYTIPADPMRLAGGAVEIRRVTKIDAVSHDLLSLDLFLVTPTVAQVWSERIRVRWDLGELWVVSRQGLVSLKRLRGSGQDMDDIRRLEGEES